MPAIQAPVIKRSNGIKFESGPTTRIKKFAVAAIRAEAMKKRLGSSLSAKPKIAEVRLPTTKPVWTALVKSACWKELRLYSAMSAGRTAVAENQSAITATWQSAKTVSEAHFDLRMIVTH